MSGRLPRWARLQWLPEEHVPSLRTVRRIRPRAAHVRTQQQRRESVTFLDSLTPQDRHDLGAVSIGQDYPKLTADPHPFATTRLIIVSFGVLTLCTTRDKPVTLRSLVAGDVVDRRSVPQGCVLHARTDAWVLRTSDESFCARPGVVAALLASTVQQLREAEDMRAVVARCDGGFQQLLCALRHAGARFAESWDGSEIEISLGHRDLGGLACLQRAALERGIRRLKAEGVIRTGRNRVWVTRPNTYEI